MVADIGNTATRKARVAVATRPLEGVGVADAIERVVVETATQMPGMFEITFRDDNGKVLREAGIRIGIEVTISAEGGIDRLAPKTLISGHVFSIDAVCRGIRTHSIVRGYDPSIRMQRIKKTRTFLEMTDSDMAEEIALAAGLNIGAIVPTTYVFAHLAQFHQTDWDFLQWRAQEIGYETGIAAGKFYFRPSTGNPEGVVSDDASALESPAVPLRFKENLLSFRPSVNATHLSQAIETRAWDPGLAEALIGESPAMSTSAVLLSDLRPIVLATEAGGEDLPTSPVISTSVLNPALLTLPVDPEAHLVYDRPVDTGPTTEAALEQLAISVADQRSSTFAEAEGCAIGDPNLQAGGPVEVLGVPLHFRGIWQVTRAQHIFDDELGGYQTRFWATGRQNRSLLGLASAGRLSPGPPRINGFVCGIVTNNLDDMMRGRVKLAFPWLADNYESDWAPVVQAGAGATSGALFLPNVGDQVLVGFEHGDVRRPYILGGIPSELSADYISAGLGAPPVEEPLGNVFRRGIVSPSGMNLTFQDDGVPDTPPELSQVTLGSFEGTMGLTINQTAGLVALLSDPVPGEEGGDSDVGLITIQVGEGGIISLVSGGTITLEAEEAIVLNAPSISLESDAEMTLDAGAALNIAAGEELSVAAGGDASVEAPLINLNSV
ncbi:phage baseplate assembly protein V [Streptomyces sp. NPDC048419]|uniref:phage baseplate assembly protein V n=1 Tax=Streptomyces sp. NPDC048419 TaxID=3365547 RepID=UPI00370FCB99